MSLLDDWDYSLPPECIASRPADRRDGSRLLRLALDGEALDHRLFSDLPEILRSGDLLVANNTRVMAARIRARRATGGAVELLLLQPGPGVVEALARPARRLKVGEELELQGGGTARIEALPDDEGIIRVSTSPEPALVMARQGEMPLPPYIGRTADDADVERYQTLFSGPLGACAAPTAGLHFTEGVMAALSKIGVDFTTLTLHVGIGTFRPLRPEDVQRGSLHSEWFSVPESCVEAIARTRARGGRVIAVGTTSARALESATPEGEHLPVPGERSTTLFIQPPYRYRGIDGLLTNFHLPRSSLLMLVGALSGRRRLLSAYETAVARGYRFYSYGDAMLLL